MAVMPMQKLLLVTMRDNADRLMRFTQNLQEVEIFSTADAFSLDLDWEEETNETSDQLVKWQQDYDRLQQAQSFLQSYEEKKNGNIIKELMLHAPTLAELEERLGAIPYEEITQEALRCERELRQHQDERRDNAAERDDLLFYLALPTLLNNRDLEYVENGLYRVDPAKREALMSSVAASEAVYGEIVREGPKDLILWIVHTQRESTELDRLRQEFGLQEIRYGYPLPVDEMLTQNEFRRRDIQQQLQSLAACSQELAKRLPELQICEEVLGSYIERERQKERLLSWDYVTALTGWIPQECSVGFVSACRAEFGDSLFVELQDIQKGESLEDVPIKLKNSRLIAPFEGITEMYSLPSYGEVDPTPAMSIFYWVFFGMMVADLGYGLLTIVGTFLVLKFIPFRQGMRKQLRFFHLLGYSISIWGLVYGSFFSAALPFHLVSTTEDVNLILGLSVALGYVQILVGLALSVYMTSKTDNKKRFWLMMKDAGSWIGVLISIGVLLLGAFVLKSGTVQMAAMILGGAFLLLIVVANTMTHRSKVKGLAYGLYEVYGITSYLGDLVSYTRLMALGIAGGSIGLAFNMIIGFLPAGARFSIGIVLLIALHALNLFLSMLSAYVHGARLQFVEFFGKFYSGGGRAFSPLKAVERHFDVRAAGGNGKEES